MNKSQSLLDRNAGAGHAGDAGDSRAVERVADRQADRAQEAREVPARESRDHARELTAGIVQLDQQGPKMRMDRKSENRWFSITALFNERHRVALKVDSTHWNLRRAQSADLVQSDFKGDRHPVRRAADAVTSGEFRANLFNLRIAELGLLRNGVAGDAIAHSQTGIDRGETAGDGLAHHSRKHLHVVDRGVSPGSFSAAFLLRLAPVNEINHVLASEQPRTEHGILVQKKQDKFPRTEITGEGFWMISEAIFQPLRRPAFPAILLVCATVSDTAHPALTRKAVRLQFPLRIVDQKSGRFIDAAKALWAIVSDVPRRAISSLVDRNPLHVRKQTAAAAASRGKAIQWTAMVSTCANSAGSWSWFESMSGSQLVSAHLGNLAASWQQGKCERRAR